MEDIIVTILKKCNLITDKIDEVNGLHVPREIFLNETKYKELEEDILKLKKFLCSSSFTSLHNNAKTKQNWPLLNLVRQILKINNYKMKPYKKSNGYTKGGTKLYRRYFVIEKIVDKECIISSE